MESSKGIWPTGEGKLIQQRDWPQIQPPTEHSLEAKAPSKSTHLLPPECRQDRTKSCLRDNRSWDFLICDYVSKGLWAGLSLEHYAIKGISQKPLMQDKWCPELSPTTTTITTSRGIKVDHENCKVSTIKALWGQLLRQNYSGLPVAVKVLNL